MAYLDQLLATDEQIQRVARRHWIVLVRSFVLNGLAILLAALLAGITAGFWRNDAANGTLWGIVTGLLLLGMLVFVARIVIDLVRWSSTQYVVTTRRVIEVSGVFNKVVRDSNLDKINDLVLTQSALGRTLNYGDIEIVTGADIGVNQLEKITDPIGFKRTMLDNKEDLDSLVHHLAGPE
jgi:uncharacterized membrane protein YdbT with pleckstrin-like domain